MRDAQSARCPLRDHDAGRASARWRWRRRPRQAKAAQGEEATQKEVSALGSTTSQREERHGYIHRARQLHRTGRQATQGTAVKRADAFKEMARKAGVTVKDVYWTLGRFDVVAICEAPDDETATALTLEPGRARQCPHPDAQGLQPGRDGQDHRQDGLTHPEAGRRRVFIVIPAQAGIHDSKPAPRSQGSRESRRCEPIGRAYWIPAFRGYDDFWTSTALAINRSPARSGARSPGRAADRLPRA